jgi:hypothetical protein
MILMIMVVEEQSNDLIVTSPGLKKHHNWKEQRATIRIQAFVLTYSHVGSQATVGPNRMALSYSLSDFTSDWF